jgi:hypothetical protein
MRKPLSMSALAKHVAELIEARAVELVRDHREPACFGRASAA